MAVQGRPYFFVGVKRPLNIIQYMSRGPYPFFCCRFRNRNGTALLPNRTSSALTAVLNELPLPSVSVLEANAQCRTNSRSRRLLL